VQSVQRQGRAQLIHYEAQFVAAPPLAPVMFIPSLINAPDILDLTPDNSLLRYLAAQGHDVYQVDWGTPDEADRGQTIGDHVTDILLPLIATLPAPPILVGYCLGGTMALAAASLVPSAGLATLAAPWDFDAYPKSFRDNTRDAWAAAQPMCDQLGVMPMEILQTGFWSLDPRRTIGKYSDFADLAEDDPRYFAFLHVEDWVNEGAPLTYAAGHDLIENFYGNNMTADGNWRVGGVAINPEAIRCSTLAISSSTDRIVPHASRPSANESLTLDLGHVGMVIGRAAPEKLWRPLSQWLRANGA
jgi:polyhydroxyalkanoate synthase